MFFFLFFLFNVFGHQRISKLYESIVVSYGREKVEKFLVFVAVAGFLILTGWIVLASFRRYKNLLQPCKMLSLWFIAVLLCYGAYGFLICSKVEIVHFPQYAILAFWGMFLIRDTARTVFIVTFLGIFDETFNYIFHSRFTPYLDLNDMVLNFCGALVGTVFYHTVIDEMPLTMDHWAFKLGYVLVFLIVALIIVGIVTGKIVLENTLADPTTPLQNGQFILSFQHYEPFWRYTSAGVRYHIMTPVEGILLIGTLLSAVHAVCSFFTRQNYDKNIRHFATLPRMI